MAESMNNPSASHQTRALRAARRPPYWERINKRPAMASRMATGSVIQAIRAERTCNRNTKRMRETATISSIRAR